LEQWSSGKVVFGFSQKYLFAIHIMFFFNFQDSKSGIKPVKNIITPMLQHSSTPKQTIFGMTSGDLI
jgi:hypothetical protein